MSMKNEEYPMGMTVNTNTQVESTADNWMINLPCFFAGSKPIAALHVKMPIKKAEADFLREWVDVALSAVTLGIEQAEPNKIGDDELPIKKPGRRTTKNFRPG